MCVSVCVVRCLWARAYVLKVKVVECLCVVRAAYEKDGLILWFVSRLQVLNVHQNGCQISGICFAPSGRRLYVGMGELGVNVYDVDMADRTTFSRYDLS